MEAAADWARLKHGADDRYYSRRRACPMRWSLDAPLSQYTCAAMQCGGPIALLHGDGSARGARMRIFTGGGVPLSAWEWDYGRVRKLGWTPSSELACVLESGRVLLWSLHGARLAEFGLGAACEQQGVLQCEMLSDGLVALTAAFQLVALLSFTSRKIVGLADARLASPPCALACLERTAHERTARCPEVLLATASRTILRVDETDVEDQLLVSGPFVKLAPSPNGNFLAAFSASGSLLVFSSDFSRNLSEFETKSERPPRQLVWCGGDSLLLGWDRLLVMVGPYGDCVKYFHDSPLLLLPELDCVRIVSAQETELLQRVPAETEAIFKPGSLSAAARLLEASEAFAQRSPRSDELLRSVGDELLPAIQVCLRAAHFELSTPVQQQLLRAASFGKVYADGSESAEFIKACKQLRVLNALRAPEVGMMITWAQYELIGPRRVLYRLLAQHQHLLAHRIASYLRLPRMAPVITHHWGCAKIHAAPPSVSDEALVGALMPKLRGCTGVALAEVAAEAHRVGRRGLATLLLEHETSAARQVPLLLRMDELPLALRKAVSSADTELMQLVILHAKAALPMDAFFNLLLPHAEARRLFVSFCEARDGDLLKSFYYHADLPLDAAAIAIKEAYRAAGWSERMRALTIALQFFTHTSASKEPTSALYAKQLDEQIRLLEVQRRLEAETHGAPPPPGAPPPAASALFRFVDTPLNETIYKCFCYNKTDVAEQLRSDFKVPEKRWWLLKVRGLAHAHSWAALWDACPKRPPVIGFKPFAEACIAQKKFDEAARYALKLAPADAVTTLLRIGNVDAARSVAVSVREKQPELLSTVNAHVEKARS